MEDSLLINSDHEDEEEILTTVEVLNKFQEIWLNEKFCPDLLPFEEDLVQCLTDQIAHMKTNLQGTNVEEIRKTVHQLELSRITYMLSNYLQIRLEKVGKHGANLIQRENSQTSEAGSLMSAAERRYALEYISLTEEFLKSSVVEHFPANLQNFDLSKTASKPNLDSYIFLQVKHDTGGVIIEEQAGNFVTEEIVNFEKGGQHIMRYKPVSGLLKNGKIRLI